MRDRFKFVVRFPYQDNFGKYVSALVLVKRF